MPKCKGCGREIIWVKSAKGKAIPCDPDLITFCPDKEGDQVYITEDGQYIRGYDKPADGNGFDDWSARRGRVAHFATCPQADRFRRRGG